MGAMPKRHIPSEIFMLPAAKIMTFRKNEKSCHKTENFLHEEEKVAKYI
jgi:hypothetical protein